MVKRVIGVLAVVLIVGGSVPAFAGSILLINGATGTSEPGTTAAITANFVTQATALGNTVVVSDGVPGSFAGYDQVWDFRFSNNFALTAAQIDQYIDYLAGGGGMFVMGENAGFGTRNTSVLDLINQAGGGLLSFVTPGSTQTVLAPFTGPDLIAGNQITYAAPGGVTGAGSGQFITQDMLGNGTGVFWGTGQLAFAQLGALAVIFDVNWAQNQFDIPDSTNLLRNIIGGIENEVTPVPEPASLVLVGIGLAGIAGRRYLRRKA